MEGPRVVEWEGELPLGTLHRDDDEQTRLRSSMLREYAATDPTQAEMIVSGRLLTRAWHRTKQIHAAHIFPVKIKLSVENHEPEFFGTTGERNKCTGEMPLPMKSDIEQLFPPDDGYDISSSYLISRTPRGRRGGRAYGDIHDWANLGRGVYQRNTKNRSFFPKDMQVNGGPWPLQRQVRLPRLFPGCWCLMGLNVVQFRNESRPQARYLYFHYLNCVSTYVVSTSKATPRRKKLIENEIRKAPLLLGHARAIHQTRPSLSCLSFRGRDTWGMCALGILAGQTTIPDELPDGTQPSPVMADVLYAKEAASVIPMTKEEEEDEVEVEAMEERMGMERGGKFSELWQ